MKEMWPPDKKVIDPKPQPKDQMRSVIPFILILVLVPPMSLVGYGIPLPSSTKKAGTYTPMVFVTQKELSLAHAMNQFIKEIGGKPARMLADRDQKLIGGAVAKLLETPTNPTQNRKQCHHGIRRTRQ